MLVVDVKISFHHYVYIKNWDHKPTPTITLPVSRLLLLRLLTGGQRSPPRPIPGRPPLESQLLVDRQEGVCALALHARRLLSGVAEGSAPALVQERASAVGRVSADEEKRAVGESETRAMAWAVRVDNLDLPTSGACRRGSRASRRPDDRRRHVSLVGNVSS